MEKFPNNKMPEYDPWTGDRNPYLPEVTTKTKSKFTYVFWLYMLGCLTAISNTILTIAIAMPFDTIFAWAFGTFYSAICVMHEYLRNN